MGEYDLRAKEIEAVEDQTASRPDDPAQGVDDAPGIPQRRNELKPLARYQNQVVGARPVQVGQVANVRLDVVSARDPVPGPSYMLSREIYSRYGVAELCQFEQSGPAAARRLQGCTRPPAKRSDVLIESRQHKVGVVGFADLFHELTWRRRERDT